MKSKLVKHIKTIKEKVILEFKTKDGEVVKIPATKITAINTKKAR